MRINSAATALLLKGCAIAACAVLTGALLGAGCVVTIEPDDDGDGGGGNGGPDPGEVVTITIRNLTSTTLDPELFVASEFLAAADLFVAERKFTAFGVGTLGLLGPGGSDSFEFACPDVLSLGTPGGKFGDDLNNPTGTGRQILLTQGFSLFCGGSVVLTYSQEGDGFSTSFDVEP